jgi:hypothetical protein
MAQPDTNIPAKKGRKKKKHAGGRKSKFSPERVTSIYNLLRKGLTMKDACKEVGISYQTMNNWQKKGEAEKDRDESERTALFTFWITVQSIESKKRALVGRPSSSKISDPSTSAASAVMESNTNESIEQFQNKYYNDIINKNPFLILKTPTDKQKIFLMQGIPKRDELAAEFNPIEVFFNGAYQSGKTTALIMAALLYVHERDYQALLVRPDYNNLEKSIMKPVKNWLEMTGARWNKMNLTWYFPSGARLTLRYLDNPAKDHKFSGRVYQFIGCDDLTGFERYEYMKLRTFLFPSPNPRIPLRVFSTGNAYSGAHNEWVKERFITKSPEEMACDNRYTVSAVIEENPYINPVAMRAKYKNADPVVQAQLFDCYWDWEIPG